MKLNRQEFIATIIVLSALAGLIIWWMLQLSTPSHSDIEPCIPDYMGGCN